MDTWAYIKILLQVGKKKKTLNACNNGIFKLSVHETLLPVNIYITGLTGCQHSTRIQSKRGKAAEILVPLL